MWLKCMLFLFSHQSIKEATDPYKSLNSVRTLKGHLEVTIRPQRSTLYMHLIICILALTNIHVYM